MFVTAVLVLAILAVAFADISENVEKAFYEQTHRQVQLEIW